MANQANSSAELLVGAIVQSGTANMLLNDLKEAVKANGCVMTRAMSDKTLPQVCSRLEQALSMARALERIAKGCEVPKVGD